MKCVTMDSVKPKVLASGMYALDVEPIPLAVGTISCSKRMTGDHSRLRNFVKKFIRTVRFRNDHFGAIMGYGDYVVGDSVTFRVYLRGVTKIKEIFEELEAEVDQNVMNRKSDEIEQTNFLIANDNLIADCLSKEVFYIDTNSELTVSRFTKMHDAHTVVQARCLELEAELSKLNAKI
nr:integrase, catalytic region, zinc finger, CCHC-type, peptidase aspartic, catalytic [Tanacetum cinerariifolium]